VNPFERIVCAASRWWCDAWVTHRCPGSNDPEWNRLVTPLDRFMCRMPSEPWFVRWADRIYERHGIDP